MPDKVPNGAPEGRISLRQVEMMAREQHGAGYVRTAAALSALVRLVEAGKAVSAQDAGEGLFSEVDWREMNALTAALAQFADDREKKP